MSRWTHAICARCWMERNPGRAPRNVVTPEVVTCCFCRKVTGAGIYVRANPKETACGGNHMTTQ